MSVAAGVWDTKRVIDKPALRRVMKQALADVHDRTMRSVALWADLAGTPEYQQATTVMAFNGMSAEPDTDGLHARIGRDGKRLVLPRIEAGKLVAVAAADDTRRGSFGIVEPLGDPLDPEAIDVVVVPGVAFTLSGWRLGHGKGYYDGFLAGCPAPTVGVCFAEQLIDDHEMPLEPHDVRLRRVLSC